MKDESYDNLEDSSDVSVFEFVSTGRNGNIHKRIRFVSTGIEDLVELRFGDVTESDDINYTNITDNGDRDKILSTVASAVAKFLALHPDKAVYFVGSTQVRTRLYKIAISLNLSLLSKDYEIFGFYENQWLPFQKKLNPSAFYVTKRI